MSKHRKMLGEQIRNARTSANLTQVELAKKAETFQECISRAEKHGCDLGLAERLIKACGFELVFHNVSVRNDNMELTNFYG